MRNKLGVFFMVLGGLLMVGALLLFFHNRWEAENAAEASAVLMPQIMEIIRENKETQPTEPPVAETEPAIPAAPTLPAPPKEMTEVEIDGYKYIGYLYIPVLDLELPVMSQWDYKRLQTAPCRYTGTVDGEDLVIFAHNYSRHFGDLKDLVEEDTVIFTDMEGVQTVYRVVTRDILAPTAVEEVTSGAFDLVLFTCTYGGKSRVTVYCDRE